MRIAILTSGRYHVCDLARELAQLGHDVSFYSLVPAHRTSRFGLPAHCNKWLMPLLAPFYGAYVAARGTRLESLANRALTVALDQVAACAVSECELFIGMSSMSLRTMQTVRRKYGARVFLERGSRHILSQQKILATMPDASPGRPPVPSWAVDRELEEYALADAIVVPAKHVAASFLEYGVSAEKLFRNPYGTDVEMFRPAPAPEGEVTTLMTGAWSYQKGCDVLVDAWRRAGKGRLLHVGALAGAPVPSDARFLHHDAVDQSRLPDFYAQANVFALASRQEGLALVQAQALACGLPLVCTDRTGGEDLADLVGDPTIASVVPSGDVVAFATALGRAVDRAAESPRRRNILGAEARRTLSWQGYAERYDSGIRERLGA